MTDTTIDKETILNLLEAWVRQRPGLEYGNYGDAASYRAEVRSIGRDLQHARELWRYVAMRESIAANRLVDAFRHAYGGRLSLTERNGRPALEYCTGQYWPTEYRRAACAVLAAAIWDYWRDDCMPATDAGRKGMSPEDWLRRTARREFGRAIAGRWFD